MSYFSQKFRAAKYYFKDIRLAKRNNYDVFKTYGSNDLIKKLIKKSKFTSFNKAFNNTIKWYLRKGYKVI